MHSYLHKIPYYVDANFGIADSCIILSEILFFINQSVHSLPTIE